MTVLALLASTLVALASVPSASATGWGRCVYNNAQGICMSTTDCAHRTGYSVAGLCPGPVDIQCCMPTYHLLDMSTGMTSSQISCLRNSAAGMAPRVYTSAGHADTVGINNVKLAIAGGVPQVDAYFYICAGACPAGATQVDQLFTALANAGVARNAISTMWIDVESGGNTWGTTTANRALLSAIVSRFNYYGYSATGGTNGNLGIYANANSWNTIMGSGYTAYSGYLLWWPYYDNTPRNPGFGAFGGWTNYYMKQYRPTFTLCSVGVDLSYGNCPAIGSCPSY